MRQAELKNLVLAALERKTAIIEDFKGDDNPQIREIYFRTCGEVGILQSVFDALNDNPMMLKIDAEGVLNNGN